MRSLLILILALGLSIVNSVAQDRLVEVRIGGTIPFSTSAIGGNDISMYAGVGYSIESQYYIKSRIALGVFYSRLINEGELSESGISSQNNEIWGSMQTLRYGLSGKLSTNRSRFFQTYAVARFYQMQSVYNFEEEFGFSVGDKGLAGGIGAGIVFKISRTIGFNLFEINYNHFLSGMEFTKETFSSGEFEIKSGVVINLKERK